MSCINFFQWNCRSIIPKLLDLEHLFIANRVHIACITETWLTPGQTLDIAGFDIIRNDRQDGWGGSALLIKDNLTHVDITTTIRGLSDVQHVATKILLPSKKILHVVVLYNGARRTISNNEWEVFFNAIPEPKLVCGDFNVHAVCLGSSYTTSKGVHLIDAMENAQLTFLNDGTPTMAPRPRFPSFSSAVDLTLVSPYLAASFQWEVFPDPMGSDHYPIIFSSHLFPMKKFCIRPSCKWNHSKADWSKFQAYLISEPLDEQCSYQDFVQAIGRACDVSIPHYKPFCNTRRGSEWWTVQCSTALSERKRAAAHYRFSPSAVNYERYMTSHKNFREVIRKAKETSWVQFCEKLNRSTPIREIWSTIRKMKNSKMPNISSVDPGEWIEDALLNYAPPFVPNNNVLRTFNFDSQPTHFLMQHFSMIEFNTALCEHNNTAPGIDNVTYSILAHLSSSYKSHLLRLYNQFWQTGTFPPEWSKITLVPILKPGKSKGHWASYRLISLSSCLLKTMERMVKPRLEWWAENRKLLSPTQCGFRNSRSVTECHAQLACSIHHALANRGIVLALFLDFTRAYDFVQLDLLAESLNSLSFPPRFISNLVTLLSNRQVSIRVDNKFSEPLTVNQGLLQGGILSPLLYSLFVSNIDSIVPDGLHILQYADDVCVYSECSSMEEGIHQLDEFVKCLITWSRNKGLELSVTKSHIVPFTRKRNVHNAPILTLAGLDFPIKKEFKFLGLWLDKTLTWKCHIDNILHKSEKYINILKSVVTSKWGADPNVCLLFYRATIRSIMDFGCIFYGQSSKSQLSKITRLQNKCLRLCLGMLKSTPVDVLCAEACELPIAYRRELLSDRFLLRMRSQASSLITKISRLASEVLISPKWAHQPSPLIVNSFISDYCNLSKLHISDIPWQFVTPYHITITPMEYNSFEGHRNASSPYEVNALFLKYINTRWLNRVKIFTDGSKLHNSVGCAYLDVTNNNSAHFKLPNVCSSFFAELQAILLALQYIADNILSMTSGVVLCSDSLSSLKLLANNTPNRARNPTVAKILELIYQLRQQIHVTFVWIKGHSGIKFNDAVDNLAKLGAGRGQTIDILLHREEFLPYFKLYYKHRWNLDYNTSSNGSFYKAFQRTLPSKPWFCGLIDIPRSMVVALCRLRANHGLSQAYVYNILHGSSNPACIYCSDDYGDFEHLILICPMFNTERNRLFGELMSLTPGPIYYLQLISDPRLFSSLYKYSQSCGFHI